MFPSTSDVKDADGNVLVTSYALKRPDGQWSLMLVNRDEDTPHTVRVNFQDGTTQRTENFSGAVRMVTFGSDQYVWKNDGMNSHADPDGPPIATTLPGGARMTVTLPKASVTVLRGIVN